MEYRYLIRYPRKTILRAVLKNITRMILPLLSQVEISGISRIPKNGPVILAGNHVAVMEVVMMLAYAPKQVEFVGAGDIPLEPTLAPYANLYGFIPLRRGMIDRTGMHIARDVLRQKGFLVVFPEGGIWDPAGMNSRLGVAWLSQEAQAPLVPVGFGGTQGALKKMLKLQRPHLEMRVGEPIAPVSPPSKEESRRQHLEVHARVILESIQSLIPESERASRAEKLDETYELRITTHMGMHDQDNTLQLSAVQQSAVAHFICQPVMLDALHRNLKLDVGALQHLDQILEADAIASALMTVLRYLDQNPGFLTYRFGMAEGIAAAEGMKVLAEIAQQAAKKGQGLKIQAVHRYRLAISGEKVCEPYGRKETTVRS